MLFAAWPAVRRDIPDARLIIAPHEPTDEHLVVGRGVGKPRAPAAGAARREVPSKADVILVDRTGVLGDLYSLATAAFVGGGFHGAGLHSVLEPAAFGAPVAFGPAALQQPRGDHAGA